jgi:hypothetical protein
VSLELTMLAGYNTILFCSSPFCSLFIVNAKIRKNNEKIAKDSEKNSIFAPPKLMTDKLMIKLQEK